MNGAAHGEAVDEDALVPLLHCRLRVFAYQNQPYLVAVHWEAVTDEKGMTFMLAGHSKSTLARRRDCDLKILTIEFVY